MEEEEEELRDAAKGSRICVKNLPPSVSEVELKQHFGSKWEVTDAKVMRTRDGKSRKFGFVGFRTEEDAKAALKFFNKSFIGTMRLVCEMARAVGESNTERPWSRYSKGSSAYERIHKTEMVTAKQQHKGVPVHRSKDDVAASDPKLAEFLDVMQPRSKTKIWANDTASQPGAQASFDKGAARNLESEDDSEQENDKATAAARPSNEAADDGTISNMDYLRKKVKKEWKDDDGDESTKSEVDDEEPDNGGQEGPENQQETAQTKNDDDDAKSEGEDSETGRLFVRNLAYTTSEEDLSSLFGKYGELSQVHVVLDKETNRSKGFAYVLYMLPESASRAMKELDKSIFQGRLIHILPAHQPPQTPEKQKVAATFKQEREAERKKSEAAGNTKAWNSLFMRPDTVAENVAKQYGLTKREFMDPQAEDLAVRLALGETHVIAETKRALSSQGVNVEVLENIASGKVSKVTRSNRVLIVKDLPFNTSEEDLSKLFSSYGSLARLILPPTRTLAIVEFLETSEARKAFKQLAYRKFKHVPLYLEWAPEELLTSKPAEDRQAAPDKRNLVKEELLPEPDDADNAKGRSVFVKNLNFKTTEAALKRHFESQLTSGRLRKAIVKTKPSKKEGAPLSMGFGFLEFDSVETAQHVCKTMRGTVLDGHALVLQLSRGEDKAKSAQTKSKGLSSTKIIIRNVAFEATGKDLRQLFNPFGQIKKLKLPKKFDGKHRGFAFVEFLTKQEAENAFTALASTHLYGRHLVLEWAREGETLDELRARTASQFAEQDDAAAPAMKKRKT